MEAKVLCMCSSCISKGGKLLTKQTVDKHSSAELRNTMRKVQAEMANVSSTATSPKAAQDPAAAMGYRVDAARTKPLYPGSAVNVFQAVTMLLSVQGLFPGVSQRAMSEVLRILHHFLLPSGNNLPDTFSSAKRLVADFLVPVKRFDVCPNDHVIFSGNNSEMSECPDCHEERYKIGSQMAKKSFTYLPLIPRLQRWFSMPAVVQALSQHQAVQQQNPVTDIHMSTAWKELFGGAFEGDGRCLAFALSADGFDPFNHQKVQYSMCPVLLKCLNFTPSSRDKIGRMILSSLVPGPSAPSNMNPYMTPLVDELNQLEDGVDCFDASTGRSFKLKARVILGVFDNPGSSKVLKSAGPGSIVNACRHCTIKGEYSRAYKKVLYLENRRYLKATSPLRDRSHGFLTAENRPPHDAPSVEDHLENGRRVDELHKRAMTDTEPRQRKKAKTAACRLEKETGKKGVEELSRLPYYADMEIPVELMHTVQVVMKKFFGLFTGRDNTPKMHASEASLGRPADRGNWTLTTAEKAIADERITCIQTIHGFDWSPKKLFTCTTLPYMKCSDWKKLAANGILKYVLRDMLGENQRNTFFQFCDVVHNLTNYAVDLDNLPTEEEELHRVLALVERDFPLGMQTLCMHILHHASKSLQKYGPATSQWMYGFERFMAFLGGRILNRKQPEATAVEAYRLYEFSQFMAMAGYLPKGSVCTSNTLTVLAATEESIDPVHDEVYQLLQGKRPSVILKLDTEERDYVASQGLQTDVAEKFFLAQREYPRCQKYTCCEIDTNKPVKSSFVAGLFTTGGTRLNRLGKHYLFYGQIVYFLLCKVGNNCHKFAKVGWKGPPVEDNINGIWKISNADVVYRKSLVPIADLSPPLTTALETDGTLWILDMNPKLLHVIE